MSLEYLFFANNLNQKRIETFNVIETFTNILTYAQVSLLY
jgi:hypothetical protein